ncbi:hypothetical protein F6X40_27420 [Paraburkholderia sp. UCT31]|nr:hypothetical protein [Paraburkholderia sp. UCT31]
MDTAGKVTQIIQRDDGSEVKIVAQKFFGLGLTCSIDVYVLRRESPNHSWMLASNRPHPDWRKMSVDDYVKRGRSEMLQAVSHGEILKVTSALASTGM